MTDVVGKNRGAETGGQLQATVGAGARLGLGLRSSSGLIRNQRAADTQYAESGDGWQQSSESTGQLHSVFSEIAKRLWWTLETALADRFA